MSIRVLIVDDHAAFRGLARALLTAGEFEVIGEAADADEAIRAAAALRPDVVLLDVQMPGRTGFEVADELARRPGAPTVVLVSSRSRDDYGRAVQDSPAHGFLTKSQLSAAALREVLADGRRSA